MRITVPIIGPMLNGHDRESVSCYSQFGGSAVVSSLSVGPEELRIIGHSINWQLNVPYEHTPPPQLNEQDTGVLLQLFNDLCSLNQLCLSGLNSVLIEVREPYLVSGGRMQLPKTYFRLMIDAVTSFFTELRSSPTELEVVTGLPLYKTSELLSRLQAAYKLVSDGSAKE